MKCFVLTEGLEIAGIVLEIALELVASQDFLFDFLQSRFANRDTRHGLPGVSRSIPVTDHVELLDFKISSLILCNG